MFETSSTSAIKCYHCGEDCPDDKISIEDHHFCCEGCKIVYQVLHQNDLCTYYAIESTPGTKVKELPSTKKFAFLDDEGLSASLIKFRDSKISRVTFYIPSMHCSSCIWLLENIYKVNPAITESKVNFLAKTVSLTYLHNEVSLRQVVEILTSVGYEPQITLEDTEAKNDSKYLRSLYYKVGIAGFSFGNIMMLSFPEYLALDADSDSIAYLFRYLNVLLSLPVFFYCSTEYFTSAYKSLKKGVINIDFPLSLGIIALFGRSLYEIVSGTGGGYMDSFTGLLFFLLLGKLFQRKTFEALNFERNYRSYFPVSVTVIRKNEETTIPLANIKSGDRLLIRHNELIPADAILFSGEGNIDYSFVTGESTPVVKVPGERIYAGGKQTGGVIEVEAVKDVSQSYLTQLWNDKSFKEEHNSNITEFSNIVSKYFTFILLAVALGAAGYWLTVDYGTALSVFTAVLIVACPCALALSTPFALGNTLRIFSRNNLYLKHTTIVERLAKADTIVFDKTGTLTETGQMTVEYEGEMLSGYEKSLVKSLATNSLHPLSRRILDILNGVRVFPVKNYTEKAGLGISAEVEGKSLKLGSIKLVNGVVTKEHLHEKEESSWNKTIVFLSIDGMIKGKFVFSNVYREGIGGLIDKLKKNFKLFILSGDNESEKTKLRAVFGNDDNLYFNQSPFDKLEFIKKLKNEKKKVIMLGDGLNDAGALAAGDVGISVADDISNFTPASDAIIKGTNLPKLYQYINFSKTTLNIIKFSFVISAMYNLIGIGVAVTGNLSPLFAAILMPVSSVTVIVITVTMTTFFAKRRGLLK
ncbi:MAG: heavy metal translocating P-type ATPase metal-binding domain-containing protein [Ignavibacteriaceae bacterium]|nr:heavy metal translocating P-type ATPase metal-binding domain-containing protein [Ignavibacteriaceae bacterium]